MAVAHTLRKMYYADSRMGRELKESRNIGAHFSRMMVIERAITPLGRKVSDGEKGEVTCRFFRSLRAGIPVPRTGVLFIVPR
jgi:hypothetical protein